MADTIIEASDLELQGAYTSLGTYDHDEIVQLVTHLSDETKISVPDLIHSPCLSLPIKLLLIINAVEFF